MSPPRAQGWQCIIILLSWSLGANAFINSPLLAKKRPMQSIFSAKAPSTDDISFERLTGLSERIRLLLDKEVDYQMGFWDRGTCFSLFTILGNFEAWQGIVGASDADPHIRVPLSRMREALLAGRWTFDAFQTPIVISAMLRLAALLGGGGMGPDGTEQFNKGIRVLLDNRLRLGMHGRRSKVSAYVAYWNTCAFLQLLAYGAGASAADAAAAAALDARGAATAAVGAATPEEMRMAAETGAAVVAPQELVSGTIYGEVTTAVEQALVVSADEICRQMAYHAAGDYTNFDVVKLAYSLLTHHRVATSEGCFNRGPSMLNSKVVQKALDIVFMQQQPDGLWAQGQAIYNPGDPAQGAEGSAARVAADVGNSYAFTFDLLGSLLEVFSDVPSLVGKYHVQLERALMWAEDNVILQVYDEMCDVHRRTVEGTVVRGWRSNHLQTDQSSGPLGWSTAQVLFTLNRMRAAFRACLIKDVLSEFKGTVSTGANPQSWNRLMDSSLYLEGESASFKDTVAARLLSPLVDPQGGLPWAVSNRTPRRGLPPAYSAILFGPPGTAKTTTAQAIARYLGYNFLVVDTADFLADGMQNVASRMTYVFDKLKVLERTVILFDEIEEFCLDREDPKLAMESRMLTTAMLTQLNDLRRQQKSVFLVATNRIRSFDAAITRPGRIDLVLFLGTPSLEARTRRAAEVMSAWPPGALSLLERFMGENWEKELQFFNYAENEAFLASVLALTETGPLTEERLMRLLLSQSASTTIRDGARAEYVASARLSRM